MSDVTVKMRLSPTAAGKLFQKSCRLEDENNALRQQLQQADARIPDWIYDGYAVYSRLSDKAKARTSPENVSDTLDAIKAMLTAEKEVANG